MELVATLLIAGVILLALETVLPGMIAGVIGLCCLLAGVVMAYREFGVKTGNGVLLAVLCVLLLGTMLYFKYFPTSRLAKIFVSNRSIGNVGAEQLNLLNETGVAFTVLRPSGTAVIDGRRVDVVTEGVFVEKGTSLKVIAIEGMRVVVRPIS